MGFDCGTCLCGSACVFLLFKNTYIVVRPDELAALEWMGTFKKILKPGLHFLFPGSRVRKISTRVAENRVVTETKTKDNVFVEIHIAVQQEVHPDHAYEAIYKLNNPVTQIESFVSDVVRSHAPQVNLDQLFEAKDEIATEVKTRLQHAMAAYGYEIHQCLVTDISPDKSVKAAMNQISAQRRNRQAMEEKAEADKIIMVKAAEADAESKFLQGQGTARAREAIVIGLRNAIAGGDGPPMTSHEVSELLLMTQYLDALETLAKGSATTVFVPSAGTDGLANDVRAGSMQAAAAAGGLGQRVSSMPAAPVPPGFRQR